MTLKFLLAPGVGILLNFSELNSDYRGFYCIDYLTKRLSSVLIKPFWLRYLRPTAINANEDGWAEHADTALPLNIIGACN